MVRLCVAVGVRGSFLLAAVCGWLARLLLSEQAGGGRACVVLLWFVRLGDGCARAGLQASSTYYWGPAWCRARGFLLRSLSLPFGPGRTVSVPVALWEAVWARWAKDVVAFYAI